MTYGLLYINVMSIKHETLAEFTSRIIAEKNLSFRRVAEQSGGGISHSTVADIANAQRFDVKKDTLTALAKGLGVAAEDVFRVARGLTENPSRFEIYAETFDAHDLSESEWQMLETYFRDHVETWKRFQKERVKAAKEALT